MPSAAYGVVLLMCSMGLPVLVRVICGAGGNSAARGGGSAAMSRWLSLLLYACGIGLAFVNQWLSDAIYVTVALMWLVPDRRISTNCGANHRDQVARPDA